MLEKRTFETTVAGKKLTAEFTSMASQANGSVILRYGDTMVFATAVMASRERENIDFFPLVVDYEEKFYASGRILGSRFLRREGKPSEEAILTSRLIDRTIRPLFDHRIRNDVQVVAFTASLDEENSPDILGILASSIAIFTSDIPWRGPVSAVRLAQVDERIIVNPTYEERSRADLDIVVSGSGGYINMIEGKAKEVPENVFIEAVNKGLQEISKLNDFQLMLQKEVRKEKRVIAFEPIPEEATKLLENEIVPKLEKALYVPHKTERMHILNELKKEWNSRLAELQMAITQGTSSDMFEEAIDSIIHRNILEADKRPDGRGLKEIRPLYAEAGILTRTHGSGLFYRGDTHILSALTLGAPQDVQLIEGMEVQTKKHFMHHYNFPPYSVGEVGRMGSPGRREIGHGALAEKALEAVIPSKEVFPYTIRIVSETLSSNGSSSMGSVCASTIALMDAGVPILRPVAGIAMGLMMESDSSGEKQKYKVLTDIQGPEDHHGDMDFKAAGTEKGVTAVQMDVKIKGITTEILEKTLADARDARLHILATLKEAIAAPREDLSPYAPRIYHLTISIDKIRDVIGPGGKTINEIISETGATIDIEQTGDIFITAPNEETAKKAEERISAIVREYKPGEVVKGKVSRLFEFGAMVEYAPRQEGLVHISELADFRVAKVTDIVNIGDVVTAKIIEIDSTGRVNLSIRALNETEEETKKRKEARPPRSDKRSPPRHR